MDSEARLRDALSRALIREHTLGRTHQRFFDQPPSLAAGKLEQRMTRTLTEVVDSLTVADRAALLSLGLDQIRDYRMRMGRHLAVPTAIPEDDLAIYVDPDLHVDEETRQSLTSQLGEDPNLSEDEVALFGVPDWCRKVGEPSVQVPVGIVPGIMLVLPRVLLMPCFVRWWASSRVRARQGIGAS